MLARMSSAEISEWKLIFTREDAALAAQAQRDQGPPMINGRQVNLRGTGREVAGWRS